MEIKFRGKLVGFTIGDVYVVHKKPEHFMRKFGGFGVSAEVLNELIAQKIKKIRMVYNGVKGETIFEFPIEAYLNSKDEWVCDNDDIQKFVKSKPYEINILDKTLKEMEVKK